MSRNLGDGKEPVVGRYGEEFSVLNGKHKRLTIGIDLQVGETDKAQV